MSSVNNNVNGIQNENDNCNNIDNFNINDDGLTVSNFSDHFYSARGAITNESAAGISKYLSFASALFKATIFVILCPP